MLVTVPGKVKVEEDDAPGSPHVEPDSSMLLEGMRSVRMASSRETERAILMKSNNADATDVAEEDGMFTYRMIASFCVFVKNDKGQGPPMVDCSPVELRIGQELEPKLDSLLYFGGLFVMSVPHSLFTLIVEIALGILP